MSDDRPRITREEAQTKFRQIQAQAKEMKPEEEAPRVPWDYRCRVREAAERALRAKHITRGVTIGLKKEDGTIAIICTRQDDKPWVQFADCQVAWEDGIEPEQLGRMMVEELEENLGKVRRGETI